MVWGGNIGEGKMDGGEVSGEDILWLLLLTITDTSKTNNVKVKRKESTDEGTHARARTNPISNVELQY